MSDLGFTTEWVPDPKAGTMLPAPGFPALTITDGAAQAAAYTHAAYVAGQPRLRFRSTSGVTNSAVSLNHTEEYLSAFVPGGSATGFYWHCRFGFRDDIPANSIDTKFFIGIGAGTAAMGNANILGLLNHIGICVRNGEIFAEMLCAGTTTQTRRQLLFTTPNDYADGSAYYDLEILSQPFGPGPSASIWWRVAQTLQTGTRQAESGVFSGVGTHLPLDVPLNDFRAFRANIGAATNRISINLHKVRVHVFGRKP